MSFLRESLYGWGVCNIPQPRATQDVFADRRKRSAGPAGVERRRGAALLGGLAVCGTLLKHDMPVRQVASVAGLSVLAIVLFGMASLFLPVVMEEEPPPLEILAMVVEEPPPIVQPEPSVAMPVPVVPPKPKPPLPKPAAVKPVQPELPPPTIRLASKRKTVTTPAPEVITLGEPAAKDPVLPGPRSVERQYRATAPVPGALPAGQSAVRFGVPEPDSVPLQQAAAANRYRSRATTVTAALPQASRRTVSTGRGTEVNLPSVDGPKRNFKVASTAQSLRGRGTAKTFVAGASRPEVALGGGPTVAGHPGAVDASAAASASMGVPVHNARGIGARVGIDGGAEEVEVPVLAGRGKASGSLGGAEPGESVPAGDGAIAANVRFEGVEEGYYDPARTISLNQLKACIDPDAERNLKTALATDLDVDGKCSIRAMVFLFTHPENAYTLQVDVFNPENFVDRCDALRTAIECVNP